MSEQIKGLRALTIAAILAIGILPVFGYWFFIGRHRTIPAREAKAQLSASPSTTILADAREPEEYGTEHLAAAVNWPFSEIMALKSISDLPAALQGKTIYLICAGGLRSAQAARKLEELGFANFYNVRGGMQEWKNNVNQPCPLGLCRLLGAKSQAADLPFRPASLFEQWALSITGFGVKPLYMTLSFVLILALWRSKSPDLAALRWGMIFFLAGEACCAANYLFFDDLGYLAEYLHSYGMALAFAFTAWAAFEGLDQRVIRFSDAARKCAALELCGSCVKYADAPCGLRRTFLLVLPMLMVMAVMPMTAAPTAESYNTLILGTPYNYSHAVIFQLYETRFSPIMAEIFFGAALLVWGLNRPGALPWAKALLAAGMGWFGFAMLRLIFYQLFRDNQVWFSNWEEITELLYIAGVAAILWIFKKRLFPVPE